MPAATGNRGGESTGTLNDCEKVLSSLEAESDCVLEKFLTSLEHGRKFSPAIEKIEAQIERFHAARKAANTSRMGRW